MLRIRANVLPSVHALLPPVNSASEMRAGHDSRDEVLPSSHDDFYSMRCYMSSCASPIVIIFSLAMSSRAATGCASHLLPLMRIDKYAGGHGTEADSISYLALLTLIAATHSSLRKPTEGSFPQIWSGTLTLVSFGAQADRSAQVDEEEQDVESDQSDEPDSDEEDEESPEELSEDDDMQSDDVTEPEETEEADDGIEDADAAAQEQDVDADSEVNKADEGAQDEDEDQDSNGVCCPYCLIRSHDDQPSPSTRGPYFSFKGRHV